MLKHIIISLVFFVFAGVQINDPDPILWIILYISIGIIPLLYIWKNKYEILNHLVLIVLCIVTLLYLSSVLHYFEAIDLGGKIKAVDKGELTREFFGLLLSWITFLFYAKKSS